MSQNWILILFLWDNFAILDTRSLFLLLDVLYKTHKQGRLLGPIVKSADYLSLPVFKHLWIPRQTFVLSLPLPFICGINALVIALFEICSNSYMLGSVKEEHIRCISCQTAKQSALPFIKSISLSTSPFDLVHSDIWGSALRPLWEDVVAMWFSSTIILGSIGYIWLNIALNFVKFTFIM